MVVAIRQILNHIDNPIVLHRFRTGFACKLHRIRLMKNFRLARDRRVFQKSDTTAMIGEMRRGFRKHLCSIKGHVSSSR